MNELNRAWIKKQSTEIITGKVNGVSQEIIKATFKDMFVKNVRYFLAKSYQEVVRITSDEDNFVNAVEPGITDEQIGGHCFRPFWYNHPNCFEDRFGLLSFSCSKIPQNGAICEFGVRYGITFQHIIDTTNASRDYFGFDAFKGMPKSKYNTQYRKGYLPTPKIPTFNCDRVQIVKGWFKDTLKPGQKYFDKVAFMHIDSDIYESAMSALTYCHPYLQNGTIIQFDEIHGKKGNTRMHEYKAWMEYTKRKHIKFEVLGITKKSCASFLVTKH